MPDISPLYFTVDSAGIVEAVFPGGLIIPAADGWVILNVPAADHTVRWVDENDRIVADIWGDGNVSGSGEAMLTMEALSALNFLRMRAFSSGLDSFKWTEAGLEVRSKYNDVANSNVVAKAGNAGSPETNVLAHGSGHASFYQLPPGILNRFCILGCTLAGGTGTISNTTGGLTTSRAGVGTYDISLSGFSGTILVAVASALFAGGSVFASVTSHSATTARVVTFVSTTGAPIDSNLEVLIIALRN